MELRLPLEVSPGRQATCRAAFGTWGFFPDDARASHCPFGLLFCFLFPDGSFGKKSACSAGDPGLIPGLGRSPGEGKGCPLQYSGLEKSIDSIARGVTKSWTRLSDFLFHFVALDRASSAVLTASGGNRHLGRFLMVEEHAVLHRLTRREMMTCR